MKPYISIIVCSYNGERCLENTITHVFNLKGYSELVKEFVLIDNNSCDKTSEIMKKATTKMQNVHYVREVNPGLSNARLCGLNNTTGDWIVYIDDDNYLESDWLICMDKYLCSYPEVGVWGGAIVPYTSFTLSKENTVVLNVIYASLAITHMDRNKIDKSMVIFKDSVYGAGMTIRRNILENLKKEGWLRLEGRKGNKLTAGEDGEICYAALKMGYQVCQHNSSIMQHDIPENRLTYKYADRLYEGIYQAVFELSRRDKKWFLRRIRMIFNIIKHKLHKIYHFNNKNMEIRLRIRINDIYDEVMIKNMVKILFITR